ncbi:MAG: hypothetical protein FJY20_10360 [Bacteroidetes bacterium]|nr:hypothetical protein [Bacteroidota bacterium]
MKNNAVFFLGLTIASLTSCSSNESKPVAKEPSNLKVEEKPVAEPKPASIQFHAFKHSGLDVDSDGFVVNGSMTKKEKIAEVKIADSSKPIQCAQGEYIQKLVIEGEGEGITLIFYNKKGEEIHKKENFTLNKEISFSAINYASEETPGLENRKKGADFADWFEEAAKVSVLQNGKLIKELNWKNNGWFRQPSVMEETP